MPNIITALNLVIRLLFLLCFSVTAQDLGVIREKVITELLNEEVHEDHTNRLLHTLQPDGTWPDIDYSDVSRTGFEHGQHLNNLVDLSRAFKKTTNNPFHGHPEVKNGVNLALDFWLKHDFICENWWWNQIGTPTALVEVLLIMDNDLTERQTSVLAPIIDRANLNASGARPSGDRIKIAGIMAKHLLFKREEEHFNEIINVIEEEIKYSTGRGMQYDYSFHHRIDKINNTLSYGTSYANAFAEWAYYVSDTKYMFDSEKIKQLVDFYLDGICKMMVYGKYPDPGAKNRSITRKGSLEAWPPGPLVKLLDAANYRNEELQLVINARDNKPFKPVSHNTFFWLSDHLTHQRTGYFTSVRMYSSRNHNMEWPYNGEGLKNHHLGDGANFISRTGEEYLDIFPVFNWQKIPGTTTVQKTSLPHEDSIQQKGLTNFVGGVSDGFYGAACFDFVSPHDSLSARKAWFFFDNMYVCLGSGITSENNLPVTTTLNQCLLNGKVMATINGKKRTLEKGKHHLEKVKWVFHDNIAYIFPDPVHVNVSNNTATGNWKSINRQSGYTDKKVEKDVFCLWLNHGINPKNKKYQYLVMPDVSIKDLNEKNTTSGINILSNTDTIQAVYNRKSGIFQIIFYHPGSIRLEEGLSISSEDAGLVMVSKKNEAINRISISDPSRELDNIRIKISAELEFSDSDIHQVHWNDKDRNSEIVIHLPKGVYAGKSVVLMK